MVRKKKKIIEVMPFLDWVVYNENTNNVLPFTYSKTDVCKIVTDVRLSMERGDPDIPAINVYIEWVKGYKDYLKQNK